LKIAGLSIEGSKIKASIAERKFGSSKPIATDEVALPPNPEEMNVALKEALGNWKSSYGIDCVTVGLSLSHFSHRMIELPVRSREDIKHALIFEMEKHLPLEPDQYSMDFHTIETSEEGTKNLVLAIRKDKVRWIFECLAEVGLRFHGVKCTALEAANELISTVNVSDALLVYPADGIFQIIGLTGAKPAYLKVAKSREAAIADIEKSIDTYGQALYIAGEGSALEFDRFAPRTLPLNMPSVLASMAAGKSHIKTDFTPEEFSTPKKDLYPYALVLLCIACVIIFFSTSFLAYIKDYRALHWVDTRIGEMKTETRGVIETVRKADVATEKVRFLSEFQHNKNAKIKMLAELSSILPKTAWLTSLSADEQGTIEIEGFATSAADIISPIENSPLFKDVEFSSPVTVKEGVERFSLKLKTEEAETEEMAKK
jgi:hypothetical protein